MKHMFLKRGSIQLFKGFFFFFLNVELICRFGCLRKITIVDFLLTKSNKTENHS